MKNDLPHGMNEIDNPGPINKYQNNYLWEIMSCC